MAKVPPKEKVGVGREREREKHRGKTAEKKSQICEEVVRIFECFFCDIVK